MTDNLEDKIIRLEENVFFAEEKLKKLEQYLFAQDDQIKKLECKIKSIECTVRMLKDLNTDSGRQNISESLPPHWQLGDWKE